LFAQRGARKVYAIDVATVNLPENSNDPRNCFRKTMHAHSPSLISEAANICVIDVSFISDFDLAECVSVGNPSGMVLALIKPQFELSGATSGRRHRARRVLHEKAQGKIVSFVEAWA
jgi:23S rRNA (cytidine1920-2'-O)/16S rRNA (cytidine1409-2'-O)-methyltransferase